MTTPIYAAEPTMGQIVLVWTWVLMYFVIAALLVVVIVGSIASRRRINALLDHIDADRAQAAEDRKLAKELMINAKAILTLLEHKEARKVIALEEAKEVATQTREAVCKLSEQIESGSHKTSGTTPTAP